MCVRQRRERGRGRRGGSHLLDRYVMDVLSVAPQRELLRYIYLSY